MWFSRCGQSKPSPRLSYSGGQYRGLGAIGSQVHLEVRKTTVSWARRVRLYSCIYHSSSHQ